jgi:hypothetical protein
VAARGLVRSERLFEVVGDGKTYIEECWGVIWQLVVSLSLLSFELLSGIPDVLGSRLGFLESFLRDEYHFLQVFENRTSRTETLVVLS